MYPLLRRLTMLSLVSSMLSAQDSRFLEPDLPPVAPAGGPVVKKPADPVEASGQDNGDVILPELKGLVFVDAPSAVLESGSSVPGLDFSAVPRLEDEVLVAKLRTFLDRPASLHTLELIRTTVSTYLSKTDYPFASVVLPPQDITSGTVQYLVIESKLGEMEVTGNRYFASHLFREPIMIDEGDSINIRELESGLAWINRNGFRHAEALASEGGDYGTTNFEISVQDRFPLRVYTGYNDNGSQSTDFERVEYGLNYGNVFGLGHLFNYQLTADPDFDNLIGHSASYIIDYPWHHSLILSGAYSSVTSDLPAPFDQEGSTAALGAKYEIELDSMESLRHFLILGLDYKQSENALNFSQAAVSDFLTDFLAFSVGYRASLRDRLGETSLQAAVYLAPEGITSHSSDADFNANRVGADPNFAYGVLFLNRHQPLGAGFDLNVGLTGQIASTNLLGTEQLVMGGATAVRGFGSSDLYADRGAVVRTEVATPPVGLLNLFGSKANPDSESNSDEVSVPGKTQSLQDQIRLIAFYDLGVGGSVDPLPGEEDYRTLQSCGVGLRYHVQQNLSINFDYGWQLSEVGAFGEDSRGHVSMQLSF